jgi:hypothetical protein
MVFSINKKNQCKEIRKGYGGVYFLASIFTITSYRKRGSFYS